MKRVLKWFFIVLGVLVLGVGGVVGWAVFGEDYMHTVEGRRQYAALMDKHPAGSSAVAFFKQYNDSPNLFYWHPGDEGRPAPRPKGVTLDENVPLCSASSNVELVATPGCYYVIGLMEPRSEFVPIDSIRRGEALAGIFVEKGKIKNIWPLTVD